MLFRVLAAIILLFSILFLPFWVSFLVGLAGMFYFKIFSEAVALFLLSDLLHGAREERFYSMVFISFLISALFLLIIEIFKKKLKFYA